MPRKKPPIRDAFELGRAERGPRPTTPNDMGTTYKRSTPGTEDDRLDAGYAKAERKDRKARQLQRLVARERKGKGKSNA